MIDIVTLILVGLAALAAIATVVGVVDAAQNKAWRGVAAERRRNWEMRQELMGRTSGGVGARGDDYDD
jgi:type II secretory pathway pseudopilin PulG